MSPVALRFIFTALKKFKGWHWESEGSDIDFLELDGNVVVFCPDMGPGKAGFYLDDNGKIQVGTESQLLIRMGIK